MSTKSVGHYLREWRLENELTQTELARRIKMSPSNYSQIEAGKVGYTQDSLQRLAKALGQRPATLLGVNPLAAGPDVDREDYEFQEEAIQLLKQMSPYTRALAYELLQAARRHETRLDNESSNIIGKLTLAQRFKMP